VRAWFRKQDAGDNRSAGRAIAERELARIGARAEHLSALAQELKARDTEQLYELRGEGELTVTQLLQAAARLYEPAPRPLVRPPPRSGAARRRTSPVDEVGDCRSRWRVVAHRCAPSHHRYVTLGRGVTVRSDRSPRMAARRPTGCSVEWASADTQDAGRDCHQRHDRRGLRWDLSDVLRRAPEHRCGDDPHDHHACALRPHTARRDLEQLAPCCAGWPESPM
jgi:(p)ppGpp synthase/HD superfamily hydrolase